MVPAAPAFIMGESGSMGEGLQQDEATAQATASTWGPELQETVRPLNAPAEIVALLSQYDWPVERMARIIECESGYNPSAYNGAGPYYGLLQIDYEFPNWDDPATNIAAGYAKYESALNAWGDGLTPWPACRWY